MKNKKIIALVDRIEELKDENHRLMIGRDRLKNQIAAAKNEEHPWETEVRICPRCKSPYWDRERKK